MKIQSAVYNFHVPLENRRHLSAGGTALRIQSTVGHAADDAVHGHPAQGLIGVTADALRIRVIQLEGPCTGKALAFALGIAVQHGGQLFPGHGAVGVSTVGNTVIHSPGLAGCVPHAASGVGGVRAVIPGQNGPDHGSGHGSAGIEGRLGVAGKQFPAGGEVDGIRRPVGATHVGEVLAVVHDFHGVSVAEGNGHTVIRGDRGLNNLLCAVGLDEDRHGAGSHPVHGNLHLGAAAAGQVHGHGRCLIPVGGDRQLRHGQSHGLAGLGGLLNHLDGQIHFRLHLSASADGSGGGGTVLVVHGGLGGAIGVLHHLGLVAGLVGAGSGHGAVLLGLHDLLGPVGVLGGLGDGAIGAGYRRGGAAVGVLLRLRLTAGGAAGRGPAGGGTGAGAVPQFDGAGGGVVVIGVVRGEDPLVVCVGLHHSGRIVRPLYGALHGEGTDGQLGIGQGLAAGGNGSIAGRAGGGGLVDGHLHRGGVCRVGLRVIRGKGHGVGSALCHRGGRVSACPAPGAGDGLAVIGSGTPDGTVGNGLAGVGDGDGTHSEGRRQLVGDRHGDGDGVILIVGGAAHVDGNGNLATHLAAVIDKGEGEHGSLQSRRAVQHAASRHSAHVGAAAGSDQAGEIHGAAGAVPGGAGSGGLRPVDLADGDRGVIGAAGKLIVLGRVTGQRHGDGNALAVARVGVGHGAGGGVIRTLGQRGTLKGHAADLHRGVAGFVTAAGGGGAGDGDRLCSNFPRGGGGAGVVARAGDGDGVGPRVRAGGRTAHGVIRRRQGNAAHGDPGDGDSLFRAGIGQAGVVQSDLRAGNVLGFDGEAGGAGIDGIGGLAGHRHRIVARGGGLSRTVGTGVDNGLRNHSVRLCIDGIGGFRVAVCPVGLGHGQLRGVLFGDGHGDGD